MTAIDPTVVVERMARRLRAEGVRHPVAAALALAARGHARVDRAGFAAAAGLEADEVCSAERGEVAFGDLTIPVAGVGADLVSLADLEKTWRHEAPTGAERP